MKKKFKLIIKYFQLKNVISFSNGHFQSGFDQQSNAHNTYEHFNLKKNQYEIITGNKKNLLFDKVFLCAGAYNSAKIIINIKTKTLAILVNLLKNNTNT